MSIRDGITHCARRNAARENTREKETPELDGWSDRQRDSEFMRGIIRGDLGRNMFGTRSQEDASVITPCTAKVIRGNWMVGAETVINRAL